MDLALNNLEMFICHKKPTNQPTNHQLQKYSNHFDKEDFFKLRKFMTEVLILMF